MYFMHKFVFGRGTRQSNTKSTVCQINIRARLQLPLARVHPEPHQFCAHVPRDPTQASTGDVKAITATRRGGAKRTSHGLRILYQFYHGMRDLD